MKEKKICQYCKSEIDKEAMICPFCRKKQKKKATIKCSNCKKDIEIGLKQCPYCGKSLKGFNMAVNIITAIIIIGIIVVIISSMVNGSMVNKIAKGIEIDNTQAQKIEEILNSVGIEDLENVSADEILNDEELGLKGYRIKTSFTDNVILYLNNENDVVNIRWADKDFYKNGQSLLNFKDYVISSEDKVNYKNDAEERIKSILKAPDTADFPSTSEWKFAKEDGNVTVQAYVNSENSFGAKLKSEFQIKYDSNKNVVSLIIDGVEYIK